MARAKAGKRTPKPQARKPASKGKPKAKGKAKGKPDREREQGIEAVSELVTLLACPQSTISELALSSEAVLDQLDVSCGLARFAAQTWERQPGIYGKIAEVSAALIEEYERHADRVSGLLDQLAPLADEDEHADHEDLDPLDVLERIQPMLEAPMDSSSGSN